MTCEWHARARLSSQNVDRDSPAVRMTLTQNALSLQHLDAHQDAHGHALVACSGSHGSASQGARFAFGTDSGAIPNVGHHQKAVGCEESARPFVREVGAGKEGGAVALVRTERRACRGRSGWSARVTPEHAFGRRLLDGLLTFGSCAAMSPAELLRTATSEVAYFRRATC